MIRILTLLLFTCKVAFGIISIVPTEVKEDPGLNGQAGLSLSTKRGNSDVDSYKGAIRLTYDNNESYVTWIQLSGEYGEANGVKNVQKIYLHYRYIHNITDIYNVWEGFLQSQEDEFKLIQKRRLVGADYRGRFLKDYSPLKFFLGVGGFYEYITYTTSQDPTENNTRLNTYIALTYPFKDTLNFAITSYYQPKFDDFEDFVTANKLELKIKIVEKLFLTFRISYDYDSKPAIGVNKTDFSQDTIFLYKF